MKCIHCGSENVDPYMRYRCPTCGLTFTEETVRRNEQDEDACPRCGEVLLELEGVIDCLDCKNSFTETEATEAEEKTSSQVK